MSTSSTRPRDLVIEAGGRVAILRFETDRFRLPTGLAIHSTTPEAYASTTSRSAGEKRISILANNTQLPHDILVLTRVCGQLDELTGIVLNPEGGSLLFATNIAAAEAARLVHGLCNIYDEGELRITLTTG